MSAATDDLPTWSDDAPPATSAESFLKVNTAIRDVETQAQAAAAVAAAAAAGLGMPRALTGALTPTRFVGGTAAGPPASGTFAVGDFVITAAGRLWVCTAAGSPGTWVQPSLIQPAFRREQTQAQAIAHSTSAFTTISFNLAPQEDTDGGWGASATTYTVPVTGKWELGYSAMLTTPSTITTGGLLGMLTRNGTGIPGTGDQSPFLNGATQYYVSKTTRYPLTAGDTLTLQLLQNSGASRNTVPAGSFGEGVVFWGQLVHS